MKCRGCSGNPSYGCDYPDCQLPDPIFPNPNLVTAEDEQAIKAAGAPYRCCQHWPECSHVEAWVESNPLPPKEERA